jgi:hypothetical protein
MYVHTLWCVSDLRSLYGLLRLAVPIEVPMNKALQIEIKCNLYDRLRVRTFILCLVPHRTSLPHDPNTLRRAFGCCLGNKATKNIPVTSIVILRTQWTPTYRPKLFSVYGTL